MARKTVPKRKRQRIGRGRPPNESDQIIIDMAAALMEVSTLGPQQARDLALALLEGHLTTPKNLPRGYRRMPKSSILTTHELPVTSFKGREGNVADKVKRGTIKPRPDVVAGFVRLLRAKDQALIRTVLDLLPKKVGVARKPHFSGEIEN
jgi:hypothetical protein